MQWEMAVVDQARVGRWIGMGHRGTPELELIDPTSPLQALKLFSISVIGASLLQWAV